MRRLDERVLSVASLLAMTSAVSCLENPRGAHLGRGTGPRVGGKRSRAVPIPRRFRGVWRLKARGSHVH